jgi:aminocarboxymuconate-semialdehyde decarboxylase
LLIESLGVERLVMGSDYPFPVREAPAGKVIDDLVGVSIEMRERMLGRNALRFLDREEMVGAG